MEESGSIILACTWRPRGEQGRLERLLPRLHERYSAIVVAMVPDTASETIPLLDGISWIMPTDRSHGRHTALAGALEQPGGHVHYADMDRLLRWVETRPEEWISILSRIARTDCLVIGRSEQAWATHPRALRETERIFNTLFSFLLKQPLDLGAGSRGFSRAAVEFLLANSPPGRSLGTDSEWVVLLQRGGFAIEQATVDGLDWETADRYADVAADIEAQRRAAEAYDQDPRHWERRVQIAQEIVDAGLAALDRKLKKG